METTATREAPKMTRQSNNSFTSNKRGDALPPPPPSVICKEMDISQITIEWLAGDGSDRCYYRLLSPSFSSTYVLMQLSGKDAKALKENGYEWIQIGNILSDQGISVPRTVKTIPDYAAIIIEDYGDIMMETFALQNLKSDFKSVEKSYLKSFEILAKFLKIEKDPEAPWCKRSFDAERFEWELQFFKEEFLEPVAEIKLSGSDLDCFLTESKSLSEFLSSYSKHFVHRDFHSRNVMIDGSQLAVIDFQDARFGPAAYDLVSLCFDSYIPLSTQQRLQFLEAGINTISGSNEKLRETIEDHWRPMLLQRQLKAIGSFGYLSVKKNRGNYLKYVKPALETISNDWIFDKRWPFLTKTLPKLLG